MCTAQPITAAIADVRYMEQTRARRETRRNDRGAHPAVLFRATRDLDHLAIGAVDRRAQATSARRQSETIELWAELCVAPSGYEVIHDAVDCDLRRHFTGLMPTGAVGYDEQRKIISNDD